MLVPIDNVVNILKWTEDLINSGNSTSLAKVILGKAVSVCWGIWQARNKLVFEEKRLNWVPVMD